MKIGFGTFTFDTNTRELLDAGTRVHLSPRAFDVLRLLLERRPNVVSKRDLHDGVWQDTFVSDANLSVVVAEIRQALGDDSKDAAFIRTVHRVGYAFCGAVSGAEEPAVAPAVTAFSGCWLVRDVKTFPLPEGETTIGRDPRCDVWIDASGVSKRHARITVERGVATIEDLDSRNGTFRNGTQIAAAVTLADGDTIELAAVAVTFRRWSDERPPQTERIRRN